MLNKRQNTIILELAQNEQEYVKTSHFSDELNVSSRTIQNDFNYIKSEIEQYAQDFYLENSQQYGTRLIIKNSQKFEKFIDEIKNSNASIDLNYKNDRVNHLLRYLLSQSKPISLDDLADYVFVSRSTIVLDLKDVETVFEKYNLKIVKSKSEVSIEGLERDKRMCLIDNDNDYIKILPSDNLFNNEIQQTNNIRKIFIDELLKCKYEISDYEFQDFIIWTNVSLKRIKSGFVLTESDIKGNTNDKENSVAEAIYNRLSRIYGLIIPKEEIEFLAIYLNNHNSLSEHSYFSPELTNFISEVLVMIDNAYPSNFTNDVNLKLSLSLHCAPLISRVQNNIQVKNKMAVYVKQNFQYAFEIATYFVYQLSQRFNCKISEDETSFIAIYFNRSIIESSAKKGKKRVCIVTNLKRSVSFLLEQYLLDRFSNSISNISFLTPETITQANLEDYDVFFSTENGPIVDAGLALKISSFPDKNEIEKMRAIIEDFDSIDNIISMFNENLFCVTDIEQKNKAQKMLVDKATKQYKLKTLANEINLREEFGSTYFGNSIAILHPMHAVGDVSFIGTMILKKPIVWDAEDNKVKLVFLVCLQKNNLNAFQTWDKISPVLFSEEFRKKISDINKYDEFVKIMRNEMKEKFK